MPESLATADRPPLAEPFLDAETAARFLAISPRRLLALARAGHIPGRPLEAGKKRKTWRFRISELSASLALPAVLNGPRSSVRDAHQK